METLVTRLLDAGVIPYQRDASGRTPLDHAGEGGRTFAPVVMRRLADRKIMVQREHVVSEVR